ncbi:LIC_10177 family protein [Leptospira brenneri]|uniref:LIC_10177 family protein n=1 Tax=Leptospira brenneri TaxID=2023182 RepID=UPI000C2AF6BF|nr:hypothetical protein [Leptospira brenneri]PJZ43677.1 hypothetical protein CH361_19300 [Leptospira brenneri]
MDISSEQTVTITDFKAAMDLFPKEYVLVDGEFLETYKEPISIVKRFLEPVGGLHLLEADEKSVLMRVPSKEILEKVVKRADKLTGTESDLQLIADCSVYPNANTFQSWVNSGSPGLASAFAKKLLQLAKVNQEVTAKKL